MTTFNENRSHRRVYSRNSLGCFESWSSRMCHRRRQRSAYIASPRLASPGDTRALLPQLDARKIRCERAEKEKSRPGRRTASSAPTLTWTPERRTDLLRNHAWGPRGQRGTFRHLSSGSMRVFSGEWLQEAEMRRLTSRLTFGRVMQRLVCVRLKQLLRNIDKRRVIFLQSCAPTLFFLHLSPSRFILKIESVLKIPPGRHVTQMELLNRAKQEELNCVIWRYLSVTSVYSAECLNAAWCRCCDVLCFVWPLEVMVTRVLHQGL